MIGPIQQGPVRPLPTVGDTIWFSRTVAVPPGAALRPLVWDSGGAVEPLGRPQVALAGDSAVLTYPAVAWSPGEFRVEVPGPLLVHADGRTDSLSAVTYTVRVASVLPPGAAESTLAIQPPAGVVPRTTTTILPVAVALLLAAALLMPLHLWWRRRGRALPASPVPEPPTPPVELWADAGETHAVAAAAAARLRAAIAAGAPVPAGLGAEDLLSRLTELRPEWPLDQLGDLLRALEEARFTPGPFPAAMDLYQWAERLSPGLTGRPA